MFSPDRSVPPLTPEAILSDEAIDKMRREILKDLTGIISSYEELYLEPEELQAAKATPLTNVRYAGFEAWIKTVYEKGTLPHLEINETQLMNEIDFAVRLYEALQQLALGHPLHEEIQRSYDKSLLSPNEFILDPEDLPDWDKLPSEEVLKKMFLFDRLEEENQTYREERKLKDPADAPFITQETLKERKGFEITDQDLLNVGYAVDDPERRRAFLRSVAVHDVSKKLPPAHIFSIREIIAEKPEDEESLTTKELLEAFDEAGVRPATLKELLAYKRRYWKPKKDPKNPLSDEEILQRANWAFITALGSLFSEYSEEAGRYLRLAPCLNAWDEGGTERIIELGSDGFHQNWGGDEFFLVFRKEET